MRLTVFKGVVVAAILLSVVASAPAKGAGSAASIRVLFDFGDGTYTWADESIPDPSATNATWLAVQRAAQANSVRISWSWYPSFGIAVSDVGDRNPPGFVGLYEWNRSSRSWDFTDVGISSLVVSDGDAIALYNAGFDSVSFEGRTPVPTPDDPLPALEFRGDLINSGTSSSEVPDAVRVAWDHDTGVKEIGSTPAVAYGKVFVNTLSRIVALDSRTGAQIWAWTTARGFSSPAVFDNSVFVGTSDGRVVRLSASNGSLQRETRLLEQTSFSGITSSPKVAFDSVFIGTFNESGGAGEVVSLWASNLTIRWRHATASVHYSSAAYADGTVYFGLMGRYNTTSQVTFDPPFGLLALDANSGATRWSFETTGSVAASPAIAGPNVIVASKDGNVYAINRSSGLEAWRASIEAGISSPAVHGNTVFVGGGAFGQGGSVTALDASTGSMRWEFVPNGPVQASVTYADGKVLFATNTAQGTVYALDGSTGARVWSFTPSPAEYILGSPVVADGTVFAPSDNGHVYALTEAASTSSGTLGTLVLTAATLGAIALTAVAVIVAVVLRRSRRGL